MFSCSQQHAADIPLNNLDDVFPAPSVAIANYVPADYAQLAQNSMLHIRAGSKEQHRFAVQHLLSNPGYADAVAAELQASTTDRFKVGPVVSLCQVLADTGDASHASAIFPFTATIFPPIVRTSAFQALAQIAPAEYGAKLIAAYKIETESSPRNACLNAISQSGSEQGLDFIADLVLEWLTDGENGLQSSWNALLLNTNPRLGEVLKSLESHLAPFLALQAYGVRISLGERDLVDEISVYLDADKYSSAGTRSLAVQLIGELQHWQIVTSLVPSNNEKMDLTIIGLLSRDDAPESEVLPALDIYTQQPLQSVRRKALMQMLVLGKTSYFDSYLLELKEYPYTSGSLLSLTMLTDMQGLPEYAVDIIIERWPYCDDIQHKFGLVRALVRIGFKGATDFLGEIMIENSEDPEVIAFISEILGNSGPWSVTWFMDLWQQQQDFPTAQTVFLALSRYSQLPEVKQLFIDTAQSSNVDPLIRRFILELLYKVYPAETAGWFVEWRDNEQHAGLRTFYNRFLNAYY
ncbi:MAG: hypothetical protein ACI84O_001538 [Myxococcota bacterium]|jgi:hypothetical protein